VGQPARRRQLHARRLTEDVPNIKAPLLIHYAENDERVNAGWPA
jgi:dienelactone hydrolase